jgi:hypothetical protein
LELTASAGDASPDANPSATSAVDTRTIRAGSLFILLMQL